MGLDPYASGGKQPTPVGTHLDAQGNLVNDATGAIIATAAQLASNHTGGYYGAPDQLSDAFGVSGNTRLGAAINDNPLVSSFKAGDDLVHGNLSGAAGDLAAGATYGQLGDAHEIAGGLRLAPDAIGDAFDAAGSAAGEVGGKVADGLEDLVTPATADSSGLDAIRDRAFRTQDALTGRLQTLEATPTKAPQSDLVQLDQTNIDPLRQRQTTSLDLLTDAATGRVPSAAEILGREQANRAAAQAYGNAAALQGGNSSGGTLRQALDAQTQIQGDANTQLLAARAKEMSDARAQLVQGIGAARGQESADATTNANLDQNKNLANTQAAVTTHGQDVSEKGDLVSGQNTALGTGMQAEKAKVDADAAIAASKNAYKGAMVNGLASGVAKFVSDRRAKTNIRSADLVQLAEDAPGYTFEYKSAQDGPGRRVGVMAQDVARSRMGRRLVRLDDDGDLVLDGANSVGAALAMSAEALRKAEAARKKR